MKHFINAFHPKQIFVALDAIDAAPESYRLSRPAALRRVFVVMATVAVCLLFMHYGKFSHNLTDGLVWLAQIQGLPSDRYLHALQTSGFYELAGYVWWTSILALGYVFVPWLVIRFILKESLIDFGFRWNQVALHWRGYLMLLSPILVFIYLVSLGQDFVHHYPFYSLTSRSGFDWLAWELLYLFQFICLEFFFRGFMLNALRPAIGANAIWVMCVPYLMIHFPKLWLEATGAILFGLFLGILALRSRSIWGGVMVHAGVALTMDFAAMMRKSGTPDVWWPF